MAKRRSKSKSGFLKSQTIIILAIIIGIVVVLIFKPGIIASILNPLMLVLLVASLLVNAFLIYKLLSKGERSSNNSKKEHSKSTQTEGSDDSKELRKLTIERGQLVTKVRERDLRISQLELKLHELKTTIHSFQTKNQTVDSTSSNDIKLTPAATTVQAEAPTPKAPEPTPTKPAPPKNSSLFFDGPYDNRLFSETNAASEKRHRYVYRIEYAPAEPSVGKLHLEPTTDEYDILRSYSDTVLKPACEFDNAFYTSFHNISQLAPGMVQKQGNDWYVKEKVKIRFN